MSAFVSTAIDSITNLLQGLLLSSYIVHHILALFFQHRLPAALVLIACHTSAPDH